MLGYVFLFRKIKLKLLIIIIAITAIIFCIFQLFFVNLLDYESKPKELPNLTIVPNLIWWTRNMTFGEQIINCDGHSCLITENRPKSQNLSNLEAFLFYGSSFDLNDLPVPKTGIWALYHEESPRNVDLFLNAKVFSLFEITSTFSRNSSYPLTLQGLRNADDIVNTRYFVNVSEKNLLLSQIAPILYIQSNCETTWNRDAFVSELMKFIKVDSYGLCLKNKNFTKEILSVGHFDLFNPKMLEFIGKYKFMIAFENAICNDYITEKLWRPLMAGSVPIYMGSPSVSDWLPNEKSAILARNFENASKLADFLHKLNDDDLLYNEFLGHKLLRKIENPLLKESIKMRQFGIELWNDPFEGFECFVCKQMHNIYEIKKVSHENVYDCAEPEKGNSWEHFWEQGKCRGEAFIDFMAKNGKQNQFQDNC